MATIDKLDISVYNLYAVRTRMIEEINKQYNLQAADSIPPQTQILDVVPRLTELDLLFGVIPFHTPWAFFFPPKELKAVRRSPFAFHRIIPSLDAEAEDRLAQIECHTPEEEREKKILAGWLSQINKINSWLSELVGRIGQFLQG